jgi:murein DD-endopeptidase MepM/ murein hydrolase activator NlpD
MSDQPVTQNAPPAPPTVINADANVMVQGLKVDRTVFSEPLSKVVAQYQTQSAAEKRLAEANALLSSRKAQIEFATDFLATAEKDPVRALEQIRNQLQMRLGRPIRLPSEVSGGSDGIGGDLAGVEQVHDAQTKRLEAQLVELTNQVNQMRTTTQVASGEAEIARELDQYQAFKGQDEASKRLRSSIALAIAGLKNANPSANTSDLVSELHAGLAGLASTQATNDRNKLAERATTLAGVPSGSGTPALTDQAPPPTMADVKSKKFGPRLMADFTSWAARQASAR